jgi:asparagine synthase (glutamine-hydrolysing)
MCGINGTYGVSNAKGSVTQMCDAMSHRGPDDHGIFSNDAVTLGHRRLSIIDLSAAGHQPMTSEDGRFTIVYNGELYNYKSLKLDLSRAVRGEGAGESYFFRTNTDTEVVIAAYERWGKECLHRFNGMYAFALWDNEKRELFIARDRLGIKPLYYYQENNTLVFASELRSLLASGIVPKKLDRSALADYLRYQTVHAPFTIIDNVSMLMPGHYIHASAAGLDIQKYWSLPSQTDPAIGRKSYKEICSDVHSLLYHAVERRLVADVPFGAFLSGGIDSSAIVGLMSQVQADKVKTFSVVFDEKDFSEAQYSQLIAKKFKTDHHEIHLKVTDFLEELPNALKAMDHPSGDGPNTYVVSKATKNAGITMTLSGLGGDELFAGYDIFRRTLELEKKRWVSAMPGFVRTLAGSMVKLRKPGVQTDKMAELLRKDNFSLAFTYPLSRQVLLDKQVKELLSSELIPSNRVEEIVLSLASNENRKHPLSLLSRVSAAEISTYMQNVLLRDTDQMSMAHALEVRVPFIDYTLVEYVMSVPDKYKDPVTPKKLLVDAMGDLLPAEIVNRPKMGFTFPWKHWMKNELRSFCEDRMNALSTRSAFRKEGVLDLWSAFLKDDPRVTWSRVWMLVVLENWMQLNGIED